MGRRLSLIISLYLCFAFSTLHNSIFVVSQRGQRIWPEFMPEHPSQYPIAEAPRPPDAALQQYDKLEGVQPGGQHQPFLGQSDYDVATLQPLLLSLSSAISSLNGSVKQESTSVDLDTLSVPTGAAELGCSIYSAYQTYCKVGTPSPETFTILTAYTYTPSTTDLFASCACYSSTWWVPDLYDNAVWACNAISSGSPDYTPWVTTFDNVPTGFCNDHNPRDASFTYGLATPVSAAATSTPAPAATPATPASPVATGGASTVMVTGFSGIRRVGWALVGVVAVVISLI